MPITFEPIGVIHTPFTDPKGAPIQPRAGKGVAGTVVLDPVYEPGLRDLDGFSHVVLIYHLHRTEGFALSVVPYLDDTEHGLFATRAPRRPNPIGLSVVRLVRIDRSTLHIEDVDMLDNTPLLDLKPYVPEFDSPTDIRLGWLETHRDDIPKARADSRFHRDS